MRDLIDLHVHSTASDGTFSPSELVDYFDRRGAYAFALTDHDTIGGLAEAMEAASSREVIVVPGIELSCGYHGGDVHILGLYIDWQKPSFQENVVELKRHRITRNRKMIAKLAAYGFDITEEKMTAAFGDTSITRAHYAKYLVDHGYVKTVREAFERFLKKGCPCYVAKEEITIYDAMQIIKEGNGIPVLAHPMLYHFLTPQELDDLVADLKQYGLRGIETFYSENSPEDEAATLCLAQKYDLLPTGGSDFHGSIKPTIDILTGKGNLSIPSSILTNLKNAGKETTQ